HQAELIDQEVRFQGEDRRNAQQITRSTLRAATAYDTVPIWKVLSSEYESLSLRCIRRVPSPRATVETGITGGRLDTSSPFPQTITVSHMVC
ncbi:hypothetical protein CSC88_36225, partial [Klebsiella pneumoniae]